MTQYSKIFKLFIIPLLISQLFLVSCTQSNDSQVPKASKGVLDLSSWDFNKDGIISLSGYWEFYWEQLIEPETLAESSSDTASIYVQVPSTWSNYIIGEENLANEGFATFRLLIKTDYYDKELGLEIPRISSAYKLWINNNLISANHNEYSSILQDLSKD